MDDEWIESIIKPSNKQFDAIKKVEKQGKEEKEKIVSEPERLISSR